MANMQRVARPRSPDQIEELAWKARDTFGLGPFDRVPVGRLLEFVVPELIEGFELRVAEAGELGAAEAITDATRPIITFDERTYRGLTKNKPRARMTGCHELGHLLLHTGQTGHAFMRRYDPRVDLERQADIFAAAFLMPECAFRRMQSIGAAMKAFGVSRDAACCRARQLKVPWWIGGANLPTRPKKRGSSKRQTP